MRRIPNLRDTGQDALHCSGGDVHSWQKVLSAVENRLFWGFFHSSAHATWSLPEQSINSENSALDESGKVWVHILFFPSTRTLAHQKRGTKSLEKKQSDSIVLLRKHKQTASIKKQIKKLGYLAIGKRQHILFLTNLGYSASDIGQAIGCSEQTVNRTLNTYRSTWVIGIKPKSGHHRSTSSQFDKEITTLCNVGR